MRGEGRGGDRNGEGSHGNRRLMVIIFEESHPITLDRSTIATYLPTFNTWSLGNLCRKRREGEGRGMLFYAMKWNGME